MNEERESIRLLVSQSLIALCRSQLDYKKELHVDALVAITIDHKEVIVINVKDTLEFNSSPSASNLFKSPQFFSPHSPTNFASPFRNESASDLDNTIYNNDLLQKNREFNDTNHDIDKNHYSPEQASENIEQIHNFTEKNYNNAIIPKENTNQNDLNLQKKDAIVTVIAPSNSVYDDDIAYTDHSNDVCAEEVIGDMEDISTECKDTRLKLITQSTKEKSSFPKIALKSFSPSHIRNRIKNKVFHNTNSIDHKITVSKGSLSKKIILNSSLTSSQIIQNYPSLSLSESTSFCNSNFQSVALSSSNYIHNQSSSSMVSSTENNKIVSIASEKKDSKNGNLAWSDFQSMLIKSLRRNHQEDLDVKPELMQHIQAWSETTDVNCHKRLRECMQAILLYEGRYVPVRDIQRLRLSGMNSQEIRSSMEFLNSIREGRAGCYREIRGCIGVFYKCPPHLVDLHWLTLFGLNQHVYAMKFNSYMPLNATNRHSVIYWNRIHSSSPYITSTYLSS